MIAVIAIVAGAALGLAIALYRQLAILTARLDTAEHALNSLRQREADDPPALEAPKVLEGLRIALQVTQDHAHPVFANLLKDLLLKQDVAEVTFQTQSVDDWRTTKTADILISGSLTCNGYAEVYYQAEFTCYSASETICTLIERPPGGDRPENLALELTTELGDSLAKAIQRDERRRAIGELRGN